MAFCLAVHITFFKYATNQAQENGKNDSVNAFFVINVTIPLTSTVRALGFGIFLICSLIP